MAKKSIDLETPYAAQGKLVAADFRLGFIRIQGRLCLDGFGRYWPLPRIPRCLRRAWAKLAGR